jgi:signal transduction histidine kinase
MAIYFFFKYLYITSKSVKLKGFEIEPLAPKSNAIKNTPAEGKIFINIIDDKENVDIKIRDTGIGITEKEKEPLFEKFGKMERYGMDLGVDIEGSGLGLYISKEIVELHGG